MRQATITITDDLERAIENYWQDLDIPPELDAVVQRALREYLNVRGYLEGRGRQTFRDQDVYIPSIGGKPEPLENAPVLDAEHSVSAAVIEDRR